MNSIQIDGPEEDGNYAGKAMITTVPTATANAQAMAPDVTTSTDR